MVSYTKFLGLSLAAFSAVNAASVPSVTSDLVARDGDDANSKVCGCNSQALFDIINKVENFGQKTANDIAAQIDSKHPDGVQIEGAVKELTEMVNAVLNYNHGTICVDSGILTIIIDTIKVQVDLIKSLLANLNIFIFPINIIKSINDLIKSVFALVDAVFEAIRVKKDLHCFSCADVETLNSLNQVITVLIQLVDPNATGIPALSCDNS